MKITDIDTTSKAYFRPEQGENKCRIVSDFTLEEVTYPSGDTAMKYKCLVLDRKDNLVKEATFGISIVNQLKDLALSSDYAFTDDAVMGLVPPYDVTITKTGENLNTKYTVRAARENTPLTQAELALVVEALGQRSNVEDIPF